MFIIFIHVKGHPETVVLTTHIMTTILEGEKRGFGNYFVRVCTISVYFAIRLDDARQPIVSFIVIGELSMYN